MARDGERWSCEAPEHPEARHPAVRIDVELHVADRATAGDVLSGKPVDVIHLQVLARHEHVPEHPSGDCRTVWPALDESGLNRAGLGEIALVVAGVHLDFLDDPRRSELDDDPVVAGLAAPPRLPAIAHIDAAS